MLHLFTGVTALANAIPDMGALSVLSLKSNNLRAEGGKSLAEGIKGNQVIKELNIADNNLTNSGNDMSGVIALANAIPDMGALSKLDLSMNDIPAAEADMLNATCKAKGVDLALQ
jgi:Ran GTPase-activating protein (RanGAP) involved in mRNA processing and transport